MSTQEQASELPTARSVAALGPKWQLYKDLVAGVPESAVVRSLCVSPYGAFVEASCGAGMAMLAYGGSMGCRLMQDVEGMRLRDLAALCVSWHFLEATIGVAALNAWYSSEPRVEALGVTYDAHDGEDVFHQYRSFIEGKRVAVVGHFPRMEAVAEFCDLTVLERDPHGDDMPDPGCEYIVAEQDCLFMTGLTLTNKTMPRLLQLAREGDVPVVVMGPSTVPSPLFFDHGVVCLAGCVCPQRNVELVRRGVQRCASVHPAGYGARMMRIERPGWPA